MHAQLSPLKYTRAMKPATSLFPTSFLKSLLARFAIFLTPAGYHCRCYCSSLLFTFRVPPASYIHRLHRGAPFLRETCSWQKIDRKDRATGKSRALSISVPSILSFSCAHYALVMAIRSLALFFFFFFFFFTDITKNVVSDDKHRKNRVEWEVGKPDESCLFLISTPLHFCICFFHPFEARSRDCSSREPERGIDYNPYLFKRMEIDLSEFQ